MLFDSWSAEEEPDWGVHGQPLMRKPSSFLPIHLQTAPLEETDWGVHGQPLMHKSSSSLPIHLQTAPLQRLARKGSASLPVICEGSDALPAQPSSLQFMPGGTPLLSQILKHNRPDSRVTSMLIARV